MAKPNLAYIPATIGDKVYSILPSDGVGDFDFTRGTIATRINAQGLIEEVASGENRLNYSLLDGEVVGCPHLLLEPSRTNLITYSEDFSDASWTKSNVNVTSNTDISPKGDTTSDSLIKNTTGVDGLVYKNISATATGYVGSIFVKKDTNTSRFPEFFVRSSFGLGENEIYVQLNTSSGETAIRFQTGTVSVSTPILVNNYWRISFYTLANSNNCRFGIRPAASTTLGGFDTNATGSIIVWGAQLEVGTYATSYIKTTSAATTRAAETCTGSGDAATFNDSEGVFMFETQRIFNGGHHSTISLDTGDLSNYIGILYRVNTNEVWLQVAIGGVQQFSKKLYNIKQDENNKFAIKYENTSFNWYLNGFLIATSTASGMPFSSPNNLSNISFIAANNNEPYFGKTKQLQYFDTALDSEQLEQLTSWDSFRAMAEGQLYTIE